MVRKYNFENFGGELCRTVPFTSWQYHRLYIVTINGCIEHPKILSALHFVDNVSPGFKKKSDKIEKAKVYGAKRHGTALGTPEVQTLLKPKNYLKKPLMEPNSSLK